MYREDEELEELDYVSMSDVVYLVVGAVLCVAIYALVDTSYWQYLCTGVR